MSNSAAWLLWRAFAHGVERLLGLRIHDVRARHGRMVAGDRVGVSVAGPRVKTHLHALRVKIAPVVGVAAGLRVAGPHTEARLRDLSVIGGAHVFALLATVLTAPRP